MNARIELPPTKALPRKLIIEWDSRVGLETHIHAHAFIRGNFGPVSVAFGAAHEAKDADLRHTRAGWVLWLRSTQFELTETEAAEVERVFGPLGLHIDDPIRAAGSGEPAGSTAAESGDSKMVAATSGPESTSPQGNSPVTA